MARAAGTDLDVLQRLAQPADKDVVDVGCGGGGLVRALAGLGARAIGIEISAEQLAPAQAADPEGAARYLVGRAERLPLPDAAVDLVIFMRALHHVAPAHLMTALGEAGRVLRPRGIVYVAEPLAEGDYFALTTLVEDEEEVRAAAQRALAQAAQAGLERVRTVEYDVTIRLAGVDAYRRRTVSVDPDRAPVFAARRQAIAAAFARLGAAGEEPGERIFTQPMRADVLRPVA